MLSERGKRENKYKRIVEASNIPRLISALCVTSEKLVEGLLTNQPAVRLSRLLSPFSHTLFAIDSSERFDSCECY